MLVPDLWPTQNMSDRKATEYLVQYYHLQKMVKYGKTRLFVKTTMTMYFLEGLRYNRLPQYVSRSFESWICYMMARSRDKLWAV